jgi:hypothetical protein
MRINPKKLQNCPPAGQAYPVVLLYELKHIIIIGVEFL